MNADRGESSVITLSIVLLLQAQCIQTFGSKDGMVETKAFIVTMADGRFTKRSVLNFDIAVP